MNKTNLHLIIIASSFLVTGFVETLVSSSVKNSIAITHMILLSILFFSWCKSHADMSGVTAPKGSALLCGLVGIIGVPLYFYRTFGAKAGTIKTLKSLVFILFAVSLYSSAVFLVLTFRQ